MQINRIKLNFRCTTVCWPLTLAYSPIEHFQTGVNPRDFPIKRLSTSLLPLSEIYVKKTYQFKNVCKNDVMMLVL